MTATAFFRKVIGKLRFWWQRTSEFCFGYFHMLIKVQICRHRYGHVQDRIKKRNGCKIRVLFMCDNTAKWKCQSLYEQMNQSDEFDPVIGVSVKPGDLRLPDEALKRKVDEVSVFFKRLNDRTVVAFDCQGRTFLPLDTFSPDLVFFQEPWLLPKNQNPWVVSRYALTCYVPYSYEMGTDIKLISRRDFHQLLAYNFANDDSRVALYCQGNRRYEYAGEVMSLGYPMFDLYAKYTKTTGGKRTVIYAPHFSFKFGNAKLLIGLGTFEWNGREILRYARRHPEVNWIFKPHPNLWKRLADSGFMAPDERDAYYSEWGLIGSVCTDGDYLEWFVKSDLLITDSGSFLIEYLPTGNPILRLRPESSNWRPSTFVESILETYYTATNLDELMKYLDLLIVHGEDPKREERMEEAQNAGVVGLSAANRMMDFLAKELTSVSSQSSRNSDSVLGGHEDKSLGTR